MSEDAADASLTRSRAEIDAIDAELVRLLDRRAAIVDDIRSAKLRAGMEIYDPSREEEVLAAVIASADGRFPRSALRAVFREILSGCVSIQQKLSITYMGPPGSFTEVAALAMFGASADYRDAPTPMAVLDAVARSDAAFGVVAFESSTDGFILNAIEALLLRGLKIRREYVCSIEYTLASLTTNRADLRVVYGHPLQIDHCSKWLADHLPNVKTVVEDSPVATLEHAKRDPTSAVLVSKMAAERNGLNVLAERANDRPDDAMRFIVIATTAREEPRADKTAIVVTPHDGASVAQLLSTFAAHRVEVITMTSRPNPREAFRSLYFFEVRGKASDPHIEAANRQLERSFGSVTILGSYFTHRAVSWSAPPSARSERLEDHP